MADPSSFARTVDVPSFISTGFGSRVMDLLCGDCDWSTQYTLTFTLSRNYVTGPCSGAFADWTASQLEDGCTVHLAEPDTAANLCEWRSYSGDPDAAVHNTFWLCQNTFGEDLYTFPLAWRLRWFRGRFQFLFIAIRPRTDLVGHDPESWHWILTQTDYPRRHLLVEWRRCVQDAGDCADGPAGTFGIQNLDLEQDYTPDISWFLDDFGAFEVGSMEVAAA